MLTKLSKLFILGLLLAPISVVYGDGEHPIEIYLPTTINAGTTQSCTLIVEGAGTAHIYSSPENIVDTTVSVQNGTNYLDIPISEEASGAITVYATVNGSSIVVSTSTTAVVNTSTPDVATSK